MAVLIISHDDDLDASRVTWGLQETGVAVIHWQGLGNQREAASIWLNGSDDVYLGGHKVAPQDTVWLRTRPALEYTSFERSLLMSIERTGAFCINKWSAERTIESLTFQRSLAKQCGLRVPATVIVNGPQALLDFDFERAGSEAFPGIYQRSVNGCDIRINMLHREFHSFKVNSANGHIQGAERIDLPVQIESSLRRFADHADLAFAYFEMVADGEGEWWFLAVHPTGPFLWIDEISAEAGLYTPMLEFLSAREGRPNLNFPCYHKCLAASAKQECTSVPIPRRASAS